MEDFTWIKDGILLFDYYGVDSQNLHSSFIIGGYTCLAIVIEDDGFLPENVLSVYGSYLGDYSQKEDILGFPMYFNDITVPDYWEISGTMHGGEIHDLNHLRGRIRYSMPKNRRLVNAVDWYDQRGVVRFTDFYNQFGGNYARLVYDAKGMRVTKTFFDVDGQEKIVENYITGDIILNEGIKSYVYKSKTDFVVDFLKNRGLDKQRLFYNSLSTPFFVSERLQNSIKRDILFWQESVRPDIPGNMLGILAGNANRTIKVLVQKKKSYDKLIQLGANPEIMGKLGYIYPFQKDNNHEHQALICTNSDNIEQLENFITSLPDMKFHIAALTEMSSKLMAMSRYDNVSLYPAAKEDMIESLFDVCDYYLDINHENEIVSAVSEAFLYNLIILGFYETAHNRDYVADEHMFAISEVSGMISMIRDFMSDDVILDNHILMQQQAALSEESYDCLNEI